MHGVAPIRTRVLLAEDSPVVARQLRTLLAQDFDVLGLVTDGDAILAALNAFRPDVLVTDISMPGMDGLQAAEHALKAHPALCVVFITVHDEPALVARARALAAHRLRAEGRRRRCTRRRGGRSHGRPVVCVGLAQSPGAAPLTAQ